MKWTDRIKAVLDALDVAEFSDNVIDSHHGVYIELPDMFALGTSISAPRKGGVLLTFYREIYDEDWEGWTQDIFDDVLAQCATISPVKEHWNGKAGNDGISVVLDRTPPAILVKAVANYRAMPSPFNRRPEDDAGFEAFNKVWEGIRAEIWNEG